VSVTPDGRRAVSGSCDNTVRVWDVETGACLGTLEGHSRWVVHVAVTSDGKRAVSASSDKTVRIWNLETGACEAVLRVSARVLFAAISAPLNRLLVGTQATSLTFYDIRGIDFGSAHRSNDA